MKGPSTAALALGVGLAFASSRTAFAQGDPRHAIDRFEPSERGSEWLANESLDLRGRFRPSLGYVVAFSHRSLVVRDGDGSDRAPVRELAFLHVGGSIVLIDRVRLALNLPFQLYAGGETAVVDGTSIPAPPKEGGIGDLRFGADVRVFGAFRGPITGAVGFQAWAPTGQQSQWASDGVFRLRPRVMVSGEIGSFVWAAQASVFARERSEMTAAAAAGVRLAKAVVVGPEIFASTVVEDAFAKSVTPVEALFGAHWLIDGVGRIGGGIGRGLTDGVGAPAWRAIVGVEWAPEIVVVRKRRGGGPPDDGRTVAGEDTDRDGILDALDACPRVIGVKTNDLKTNGCPPDSDEDGIDDLADACPTVRGIATSDPETNGCPERDRDKDGVLNEVDACPDDSGPPDIDPRRNGCPKAVLHGDRIDVFDPVEFKPGTAEIAAGQDTEAVLTAVLSVLLKLPEGRKLRIEGHTDGRGDPIANRKLGAARAAAVAKWLVEHGIDRARVASEGIGGDRPLATNETEAGRAENRRLEFHLLP